MKRICFYPAGHTAALGSAVSVLKEAGFQFTDNAAGATHLLLPVPSVDADGCIIGGGPLEEVMEKLPKDVTVVGGNLNLPGYRVWDLLKDPDYLAYNAQITACCALQIALNKLPLILPETDALVIGWGRIGKCLASLLKQNGAHVTVAARKETDRAMLRALGYHYASREDLMRTLSRYHCIINTVPAPVLTESACQSLRPGCLKLELASGIWLPGTDVVLAHGLPAKRKPEAAGALIAGTILYHLGGIL